MYVCMYYIQNHSFSACCAIFCTIDLLKQKLLLSGFLRFLHVSKPIFVVIIVKLYIFIISQLFRQASTIVCNKKCLQEFLYTYIYSHIYDTYVCTSHAYNKNKFKYFLNLF